MTENVLAALDELARQLDDDDSLLLLILGPRSSKKWNRVLDTRRRSELHKLASGQYS